MGLHLCLRHRHFLESNLIDKFILFIDLLFLFKVVLPFNFNDFEEKAEMSKRIRKYTLAQHLSESLNSGFLKLSLCKSASYYSMSIRGLGLEIQAYSDCKILRNCKARTWKTMTAKLKHITYMICLKDPGI